MQTQSEVIVLKKKKGYTEPFKPEKIHKAIRKSAERVLQTLSDQDCRLVSDKVLELILNKEIDVKTLHNVVEVALDMAGYPKVAESYRQYRNYKMDAQKIMEAVDAKTLELTYKEDRSNANADSLLVSTKRSILFGEEQKARYKNLVLNPEEQEAVERGYLYVHDMKDRLSTFNCDLVNLGRIMKGGFTLSNLDYTEPKSLAAAMSVATDLISAAAGQQYGGMTIPQADEVFAPYAEKSYRFYLQQYEDLITEAGGIYDAEKADKYAEGRVRRECEQQYQHMEHSMNSIASSRGDFAFITFSFGHGKDRWSKLISNVFLDVRRGGQGKENGKIPVLFPKLVALYDSELYGPGAPMEDLFDNAVETAKQCMYPDFLSLDAGYVGEMYHKWGKIISPMGCVSGDSVIYWSDGFKNYHDTFYGFWNHIITRVKPDEGQVAAWDLNRVVDLTKSNISIWDTKLNDFTPVKYLIRNIQSEWYEVQLQIAGRNIVVTDNHPFEVKDKGVVLAKDLQIGDVMYTGNHTSLAFVSPLCGSKVISIKKLKSYNRYSYDVTTNSEHFEVNGIYSHNCRAYLSPEFKNSGWVTPQDENDELEIYRCNLGVVSLNLPMIYKRAEVDGRPFFDVLDEYMEIARNISKKSVKFLYKLKASCDPLLFMEGGLDGGTLGPDDCIEPVLKKSTVTFGYGGLHEITMLHNGKRLSEDDSFALETLQHINDKIEQYKKEDHLIWAIYGTPGESWLPLACEQFVKEFGEVPGVTDNGFFTNSFHMHVEDELTPIEKIDKESKFFPLSKGGCICHVRIPSIAPEMNDGAKAIIRHAMKLGMYQSINHAQNRCTDCGNHWVGDDSLPYEENYRCPKCGSMNTIGIRRMNGYLGFSKTKQGKTKFNDGKSQEFKKRKNI